MPDSPDWIQTVVVNVIVENEPIIPLPANEDAIIQIDRLSTSDTDYDTVVSWTVTADKIGILQFIEFESDDYDHTYFKLTIGGTVKFTNLLVQSSLTIELPEVRLVAGAVVLLEAASTDGTAVVVDGDILGKEIG